MKWKELGDLKDISQGFVVKLKSRAKEDPYNWYYLKPSGKEEWWEFKVPAHLKGDTSGLMRWCLTVRPEQIQHKMALDLAHLAQSWWGWAIFTCKGREE